MRKLKFKSRLLFSLFALLTFVAVFVFTASATGDPTTQPQPVETTQIVTQTPTTQPIETQPQTLQPQTEAQMETEQYETVEPEKKEELPKVKKSEVETATTVKIPDVEVSDTTLLYGVLAWLCVAVGIAAVVGVLVSKRTRQKQSK